MYKEALEKAIGSVRDEGRYRVFADIVRHRGDFPTATFHEDGKERNITVWCSNDYLAMGQHPVVLEAMHNAIDTAGAGSGGTRNIAGHTHFHVELEKELARLKQKLASSAGGDLASQAVEVNGARVLAASLEGADPKSLRDTVDQLKNKLGSGVILLAAVDGEKIALTAGVTSDLTGQVKAGDLMKEFAGRLGGKGGGRPDMAQGGGSA